MRTVKIKDLKVDENVSRDFDHKHIEKRIKSFPYKFEFVTPTGEKVVHLLKRKKGEYKSATVADRLAQLLDPKNTKWHNTIAKWKDDVESGRRKKPNRKKRGKWADVKVKDIVIDDDIQRGMDSDWVATIGNPNDFEEEFMSPIYCMYDPKKKKYISINAQHTLVLETAFAYYDMWDGVDDWDGDPMELTVPVFYFINESREKGRKSFNVYNGRIKPIEPYIKHRMNVFAYRSDGNRTDKEATQAAEIQTINETQGFEPVSRDDKKAKTHNWAITCVAEMMQHYGRASRWKFVLNTHKRYWPNLQLDTAEVDLYGFIYDYFTELKYDVYSKEFDEKFLNPCMAIIWKFFTTPSGFKSDSSGTQSRFNSKKTGLPIDKVKLDDNGSCVYLMKLYKHFGGKHELPMYVNNMREARIGDLLAFVDKERTLLVEEMAKYGKS